MIHKMSYSISRLRIIKEMKKAVKTYECVDLNRRIHNAYGIWPPRDKDPSWFYPIQYIYYRLHLSFIFLSITVICPVTIYIHSDDLLQVCEDLILMFILLTVFTKTGCMLYYRDRLEELGDKLEKICNFEYGYPMSKLEEDVRKSTKIWGNILTMSLPMLSTSCGISAVMFCVDSFLKRNYHLSIWLPYDGTVSPNFEITLLLLVVFIVIPSVQMIYIEIYVGVLMIHIVGQFSILRTNLKHIRKFAIQSLSATKSRELNTLRSRSTRSALEERAEYLSEVLISDQPIRQEILSHLSRGRSRERAIRKANEHTLQEIDEELEIRMKKCVEHHKHIIRFVHDLEEIMQIPRVVHICLYVVATGVSATWLTLVPLENIDTKFQIFCNLSFARFIETALYFYLGDLIQQQNEMVREAVYDCDWFEASEGFKRSMRIMMSMANQPLEWVAGYLITLNLATFYDLSMMMFSMMSMMTPI